MTTAFIGIGSNVAPEANIPHAFSLLSERVRVSGSSRFYTTEAIGRPEQAPYANGVWRVESELGPRELKLLLREIETSLGRQRSPDKYAPRCIDLDLILYGDEVIREDDLSLPSPDILKRPFVALPLLEIDPGLVMPDSGRPLKGLIEGAGWAPLDVNDGLSREIQRSIDRERKKG